MYKVIAVLNIFVPFVGKFYCFCLIKVSPNLISNIKTINGNTA